MQDKDGALALGNGVTGASRFLLLSFGILAGCNGPDPVGTTARVQTQAGSQCSPEDCTDITGACQSCTCPPAPLEEKLKIYTANRRVVGGVDAVAEGTPSCMGDPCNDAPYNDMNQCANLMRDFPLPAGCKNQGTVFMGATSWSPAWLVCQQKRGTIKSGRDCGGQCPANIDYLWGRVNSKCAGDYCGGTTPADCMRCLINETRTWLGNGPVCGTAATCMMEVLSSWYPKMCTKKCNSAAGGTKECTHAWLECTMGSTTYTFDGNNGIFYSCPTTE
jgi:hypothetical protein